MSASSTSTNPDLPQLKDYSRSDQLRKNTTGSPRRSTRVLLTCGFVTVVTDLSVSGPSSPDPSLSESLARSIGNLPRTDFFIWSLRSHLLSTRRGHGSKIRSSVSRRRMSSCGSECSDKVLSAALQVPSCVTAVVSLLLNKATAADKFKLQGNG
ncbi:hypothetical protein J6590_006314 [Homalodisca vitripennis]|nr:hypothetical protein J6590_006314 [Homalodisca vitripennis]